MNTFNNLPLYTADIDGNIENPTGVDFVALVDKPAIKRGFLAFSEHAPKPMQFLINEERRIISGPLMLADTPIYRNQDGQEFYVTFPAAAVERIAKKFFSQGNQENVNEMHDPAKQVDGLVMFESFLSDSSRGIAPMRGYEDAPEGSWFGSFQVNNEDVWQSIKAGIFTGFSVEGLFSQTLLDTSAMHEEAAGWWRDPKHGFTHEECEAMDELWALVKNL